MSVQMIFTNHQFAYPLSINTRAGGTTFYQLEVSPINNTIWFQHILIDLPTCDMFKIQNTSGPDEKFRKLSKKANQANEPFSSANCFASS